MRYGYNYGPSMRRQASAGLRPILLVFVALCWSLLPAAGSVLDIDQEFGKLGGWRIGFSEERSGCLAAATYENQTTIWIGYTGENSTNYFAFTNPNWKSIENEGGYRVQIRTRNGIWKGKFFGFERRSEKGIYAIGLKDEFIEQVSVSQGINVFLEGKQLFSPTLNGAREALRAIVACQRKYVEASGGVNRESPNTGKSSGTGFFVSNAGHVVTNSHVVNGCKLIRIIGENDQKTATLVAQDKTNDLALLKTDLTPTALPSLRQNAHLGENIFVYGFPLSGILATSGNFTVGSITATSGIGDDSRMFQISAPVQPGNSGGPVIDRFGNVVAVIVSKLNAINVAAATNDIPQNINFAIKTTMLLNFLSAYELPRSEKESSRELRPEAIADLAKFFTVQILCN